MSVIHYSGTPTANEDLSPAAAAVRLWRHGQRLRVVPPCLDVLNPVLTTQAWTTVAGRDGKLRTQRNSEALYTMEHWGEPTLACWAGLTWVVHFALHLAGYRVSLCRSVFHAPLRLPAEQKRLAALYDRPLLELIAGHDRGLVRYDSSCVEPARLIAQIARAWPVRHITVVAVRRGDVYALVRRLRAIGVDAFAYVAGTQPLVKTQVAVVTYSGMAYNPVEPEKQDIVIALDAVEATAKEPSWCLEHLERARLYGLLDLRRPLSPYERDLVHAVFGFDSVDVRRHGLRVRGVEVAWVPGEGRPLTREPGDLVALKRHGLWQNEARNRQIARLARAFAEATPEELVKLSPAPATVQLMPAPRRVAVLIENAEHALKLAPKLPGWPVFTGGLINLGGLAAHERDELQRRQPTSGAAPQTCAIVTQAGLGRFDFRLEDVDVLIRADGGADLPELPADALLQPAVRPPLEPLLVVDLDDRHERELRRRAERRRRTYRRADWPAPGLRMYTRVERVFGRRIEKGGRP